uniref:Uncharacterized protein n=1 Tax=Anopheles melas TaxID=34690 RepID=A0A182U2E9_9DIPT
MASAARCALIEKKSKKVRHDETPFACRMFLLCRRDRISSAVRLCSATSMHWMTCSFSRKAGIASTTVPDERGSASSMYASARHALFMMSKLCSMRSSVISAGTTCLVGNPASVSSLPITSIWHISMAACSCWLSSGHCRPCSSCCAFDELLFVPIVRCSRWCIRGPSAPNRWGGRPRASSSACSLPTSLSSLSESGCGGTPELPPAAPDPDEVDAVVPAAVVPPECSIFTSTMPDDDEPDGIAPPPLDDDDELPPLDEEEVPAITVVPAPLRWAAPPVVATPPPPPPPR